MTKQWGSWKNLEIAKEGGQSHVFKVENTNDKTLGALKRLKNIARINRFENEVEAAKKLVHPNIAALRDSDLSHKEPFAVFEWVDGRSLGEISPDELGQLPLDQRLEWCEQVCAALSCAHQQSLIHRDIKPENILLQELTNTIKVCDFGLVFFESGERLTATEEQIGSRFYIPPESEEGRAGDISAATDLYSVGKVIYYLVSGGTIFAREQHRQSRYDLATQLGNPFLEHVSNLLDKLVVHSPKDRIQTAEQLTDQIRNTRRRLSVNAPCRGKPDTHVCLFCKDGRYKVVAMTQDGAHNAGYSSEGNIGNHAFIFVECNVCGNSQRFKFRMAGEWFATEDPANPGDLRVRGPHVHLKPNGAS